jgi:hypothetical protein
MLAILSFQHHELVAAPPPTYNVYLPHDKTLLALEKSVLHHSSIACDVSHLLCFTIGSCSPSRESSARLQRNHAASLQNLDVFIQSLSLYHLSFTTWHNTATDKPRNTAVETRKTSNSTRLRSQTNPSPDIRRLFKQDMVGQQPRHTRRNMEQDSAHRE